MSAHETSPQPHGRGPTPGEPPVAPRADPAAATRLADPAATTPRTDDCDATSPPSGPPRDPTDPTPHATTGAPDDASPPDAPPALDPATLERLRRGIPLRLDRTGRFHFEGDPVEHPRVHAAFLAGLDINEVGEPTLHVGNQWCYLTVDDCPLRATAVLRDDTGAPQLRLDDGRLLPLDPATLWDDGQGLRAAVPASRSARPLAVRLSNTATMDLTAWLDDADPPHLHVGPHTAAIPTSPPEP